LVIALPLACQPMITERDLRLRSHAGALTRFALDASLGLWPIRAHSAETAVQRQHEALLVEWARCAFSLQQLERRISAAQTFVGYSGAAWLLWVHVLSASHMTVPLLLAFWAMRLPSLGEELTTVLRQYPRRRNALLRLLEPLLAAEERNRGPQLSA